MGIQNTAATSGAPLPMMFHTVLRTKREPDVKRMAREEFDARSSEERASSNFLISVLLRITWHTVNCPSVAVAHRADVCGVHVEGDGALDQFEGDDHAQMALLPLQHAF